MSTTVDETEIKYEAPPGTTVPRLGGLPSVAGAAGPQEQLLEAEYYDTSDMRLIRQGVTLRRRRGGSDAGWHLKLPAGGSTRREIRVPLGRSRQVPARLASLARGYTRGEALRPVARISTRRQVLTLVDRAGASLAEIAADDVSAQTLGEETVISQWGEVEVELTGGGPRLLKAADAQLGRKARRFTRQMKKIQSVLGDHQDAVVARGVDRELGIGAHLAGENAFTYGLLYEQEDERAARLRADAQRTWKRAPRPRFSHGAS